MQLKLKIPYMAPDGKTEMVLVDENRKPIPSRSIGQLFANALSQEACKTDVIKIWGWVTTLTADEPINLDPQDLELFRGLATNAGVPLQLKGQVMQALMRSEKESQTV